MREVPYIHLPICPFNDDAGCHDNRRVPSPVSCTAMRPGTDGATMYISINQIFAIYGTLVHN